MIRALLLCVAVSLLVAVETNTEVARRAVASYVFVANGSGVVIDPSGLILTNHHVVDGEENDLSARWADGVTVPARILGLDPVGDLALLSAPRPDGPCIHVELGNAADLVAGTPVLAVGNPFGLGDLDDVPTLTRGVLGTGRLVRADYADTVQLDAPVNPGNSGGPLFSLSGRLLGINGQIRSRTGFRINSGIGLAIACTQIGDFLPLLRSAKGGYVRHATPPAGLEFIDGPSGPQVKTPGTSGLQSGDRIVRVAGRNAASATQAAGCFRALAWRPDMSVLIETTRGPATVPAGRGTIPGRPYYGWSLAERPDRAQLTSIDPGSPAELAGLRKGDIILVIDGKPIATRLDLLRTLIRCEPGDQVIIHRRSADGSEEDVTLLVRRLGGAP